LIPDCVRSLLEGERIQIRSPQSIRPWQHVLEPLRGYLLLAQKLYEGGAEYAEAWNFGPEDQDAKTVEWIVKRVCARWGEGASYRVDPGLHPHEASYLKLDCSKAKNRLGWNPRWDLARAIDKVMEWVQVYRARGDIRQFCLRQIEEYERKD
jgi:CDP-glucose 4,6-dehydratase